MNESPEATDRVFFKYKSGRTNEAKKDVSHEKYEQMFLQGE